MNKQKWEKILTHAKEQTDEQFAAEVSKLVHLTYAEIKKITPSAARRAQLAQLMTVVSDAAQSNRSKADSLRQIRGLAEMAILIISKLV